MFCSVTGLTCGSSSLRALWCTATAVPRMYTGAFQRTSWLAHGKLTPLLWCDRTRSVVAAWREERLGIKVCETPRGGRTHRRDGRPQRVQSLREGVRCVADTRRVTCTPQRPQPPKTVRVTATAQSDSDKTRDARPDTHCDSQRISPWRAPRSSAGGRLPAQREAILRSQWLTSLPCLSVMQRRFASTGCFRVFCRAVFERLAVQRFQPGSLCLNRVSEFVMSA